MIFIIGTGNVFAETPPTYLYNGNPNSLAAAFATRETPRMAFALILICLAYHLNQSSSGQSRFVQN
jgi:hypothetical protein